MSLPLVIDNGLHISMEGCVDGSLQRYSMEGVLQSTGDSFPAEMHTLALTHIPRLIAKEVKSGGEMK